MNPPFTSFLTPIKNEQDRTKQDRSFLSEDCYAPKVLRRLSLPLAGGLLGGLIAGLADILALILSTPSSGSIYDTWLLLPFIGAIAGLSAGGGLGLLLAPITLKLRHRIPVKVALVLLDTGIAGVVIDRFIQVNYYPEFHFLLALASLSLAVVGGTLILSTAASEIVLPIGAGLAAIGTLWAPAHLETSAVTRQRLLVQPTLTSRVVALWPEPETESELASSPSLPGCSFPPEQSVEFSIPEGAAPHRYNILFLSVDALRAELGHSAQAMNEAMPELAAALPPGTHFLRAYAAGTRTTESCYSFLTGMWPHKLRFKPSVRDADGTFRILPDDDPRILDPGSWRQHHPLPIADQHPGIGRLFADAGYRSIAVVGSMFLLPGAGVTKDFPEIRDAPFLARDHDPHAPTSELIADELIATSQDLDSNKPWLLWAHFLDPHAPYTPRDAASTGRDAYTRYRSEVRYTQSQVARVIKAFRARPDADRTIFVITSDHGEEFREHGGRLHGATVYEELTHVPLFVSIPGSKAQEHSTPVSLIDLVPTLMRLNGIPSSATFDGRDLFDGSQANGTPDKGTSETRPLLMQSTLNGQRTAILLGEHKLIVNHHKRSLELYNLEQDPHEQRNLIGTEPERQNRMLCLLQAARIILSKTEG